VETKTNRSSDDNCQAFCQDVDVVETEPEPSLGRGPGVAQEATLWRETDQQMNVPIADSYERTGKEKAVRIELRTRVLIADDKRPVREGLRSVLALSPQVEVVGEAVDGQDAVGLVAERHPDVVLMDIQMPGMDGLEATRLIKRQWPRVRVVVLTLYARYRAKALSAGADVFLVKGCGSEALQRAILARRCAP
jgi:CheY-like chemotaxis protein